MKNWLKIILSMIFLFGMAIMALIVVIAIFDLKFLYIFLVIIIIDLIFSFFFFFSKRRYEVKFSWIIFINFVPFIGLCSYVFFGRKYHYSNEKSLVYNHLSKLEYDIYLKKNHTSVIKYTNSKQKFGNVIELLMRNAKKPLYQNNRIKILTNGTRVFKALLTDLQQAQEYILLTYFIVADGELFESFLAVLTERIAAGVRVYMIYDHVGSYFKISKKSIKKLIKVGVRVHKYLPIITPFISGNANYRNHRKDVIIDGLIGYTGGLNLADLYADKSWKFGIFHDTQVRIEGEAVRGLEVIFADDWYFATKLYEKITDLEPTILAEKKYNITGESHVQIVNHSPSIDYSITEDLYLSLINKARKRIWLATPYFIPPNELIQALILAARSGVDVRLTIPGLTDKIFVLDLTKSYCRELITNGVKIYEMNNMFSHNKIAIFDDEVAIVGTCNLDYRSFFSDHQTTAVIYDPTVVTSFIPRWEWDYKHAILWQEWPIKYKSLSYRLLLTCLKLVAPIL
ncbi:cardiolipin synthase [Spiroplasma endosymbiont of Stenodema calcarata]|uniref:cardiolipin synthase n=1 Tax=Spiroplasma endosymbiont of Stenodema calcarata TaxID=3139328 RepID=UPI003CCA835E